jgi:hypothetical protein
MTKQEQRINELAETLDPILAKQPIPFICEVDNREIAEALIKEGYGNVRRYRQTIIELYLKSNTAELLKFIMEEV